MMGSSFNMFNHQARARQRVKLLQPSTSTVAEAGGPAQPRHGKTHKTHGQAKKQEVAEAWHGMPVRELDSIGLH